MHCRKLPNLLLAASILPCLVLAMVAHSQAEAQGTTSKAESFDTDPGWEGFNNRTKPEKPRVITQNFGYSQTNFAGKDPGEMGGTVQRSMMPAFYAAKIQPRSLSDPLDASGSFAITSSGGSGGVFFGFFNEKNAGSSSRPTNSFGMSFDFQASGGRMAVYLITAHNKCHGNFVTPYIPGTYRPTPIKSDGTVRYSWKLHYDPAANDGSGQFTFTVKGDGKTPANFEGRTLTVDIPAELRTDETTFDHFGMMNLLVDGGLANIYFDDLEYNGKRETFSSDPGWEGSGNRGSFTESEPHGCQNFGFSNTQFTGSKAGEVGGILWRDPKGGYYADKVGPLSLDDRLEASGKVVLIVAGTDADMKIGWFNSKANAPDPKSSSDFLGIAIGGPTRVGHYFLPASRTAKGTLTIAQGTKDHPRAGTVMVQKKIEDWSVVYDPAGNNGNGSIRATLETDLVVTNLRPGAKAEGANFDRFGILVVPEGGHHVKIYFDDLKYTAKRN